MTRQQLEPAVQAAGAISADRELYLVGSQPMAIGDDYSRSIYLIDRRTSVD